MTHRQKTIGIIALSVIAGIGITAAAIFGVTKYLNNQYASLHEGCAPTSIVHTVTIKNDVASPSNVVANRCEKLTVTNLDNEERMIAFGVHEKHTPYDGVTEEMLEKGQSLTVTLVQTGSFKVHDHEHDEVQATFQVK